MAITKDGSKILLSLGRANHVAIIDGTTYDVLKYVLVGKRAWSVDLSPDETVAIVANGLSDDITVIDMTSMTAIAVDPRRSRAAFGDDRWLGSRGGGWQRPSRCPRSPPQRRMRRVMSGSATSASSTIHATTKSSSISASCSIR